MKLSDLIIDPASLGKHFWLVDVIPSYAYQNGQRTDTVTCYTKVYITSNLPLSRQYQAVQQHHPETWKAFLRRIRTFTEYRENGAPITRPVSEWRWMLEDG